MPAGKESITGAASADAAQAASEKEPAAAVESTAVLTNVDPEIVSGIICELPTYLL